MDKPKGDYGPHDQAGYADPGMQKDGKPRYPLMKGGALDEERIRAAWNYINRQDDAAMYSADDIAAIKKRIVAAWKEKIDKAGPPSAQAHTAREDDPESEIQVLAAKEVSGVPKWIQLVPPGRIEPKGWPPFINDAEARRLALSAWAARKNPAVIDYEHQNLKGTEAPAAGWIMELQDRGDGPEGGIWGRVEWTERAAGYLKNREYRFISPVIFRRKSDDRLIRLDHAALTNDPAIDGMVPVINKYGNPSPFDGRGAGGEGFKNGAGAPQTKEEKMVEWLKELLGLPETATEDEVQSACKKAIDDGAAAVPAELVEALGLDKGATVSACKGTVLALKSNTGHVTREEHEALKARLAKKDADDAVALALKDGKVTPANEKWARDYAEKDLEGFVAFCKTAMPQVTTKELGGGGGGQGGGLDEAQVSVNKMLGISAEAFKKHNDKKED